MPGIQDFRCHTGLTNEELDEPQMRSMIESFAHLSVKMSNLTFDAIGGLDEAEDGSVIIGVDPSFDFPAPGGGTQFGGPYKTLLERYLLIIDKALETIVKGEMFRKRPTLAYLVYLETRRLVMNCKALAAPETHFYLEHADPHEPNLLFQGPVITAILDWEW